MVSVVCKFWVLGSGKLRIYKLEIVLGRYLPVGVGQLLVGGWVNYVQVKTAKNPAVVAWR